MSGNFFDRFTNKQLSTEDVPSRTSDESQNQDLTTILNFEQRAELTVLIGHATESMRKIVADNFEDTVLNIEAADEEDKDFTKDNAENYGIRPSSTIALKSHAYKKEKDILQQRHSPKAAPSLDELKTEAEAMRYFDGWRESVILRVGEAVNKPDVAVEGGLDESSQTRPTVQRKPVPGSSEISDGAKRLRSMYPPIKTPLADFDYAKRMLILHSILLLLLGLEHYSAHSRVLLLIITSSLGLSHEDLAKDEIKVARSLLDAVKEMSGDEETKNKAKESGLSRKWKVGLASVAGAALIGLTGGLAAPLVAAGIGTVMGGLGLGATAAATYLGAVAGSSVIVGGLFGAYGGRMTGRMMDRYAREVEDFAFIPTRASQTIFQYEKDAAKQDRRLRVTIGISGWLTEEKEVIEPWLVLGPDTEVFALRWEFEALMRLGNAMKALVTSAAWGTASSEILKHTIFASLMAAVFWPMGLIKISRVVDNPFSVAKARSDKAGEILADALINKAQGERPVTLIGYSLGARVIYTCLQSLARRRAYGLVESAILMGSPTPSDTHDWRMMRTVVSGRLVNVYSDNDVVLGFLYRMSSVQLGVAGLQPVEGLTGVENVNVSGLISGHLRYRYLVGTILTNIGFDDINGEEVAREEEALRVMDREVEQERQLNEENDKVAHRPEETESVGYDENEEIDKMEKEIEQKTKHHVMQHERGRIQLIDND